MKKKVEYPILVFSLKRLYSLGKVTTDKVDDLLEKGTISEEEYNYILE